MTGPDPQREPRSETEEKKSILKSHEEFVGEQKASMTKAEYEKQKERERREEPGGRGGKAADTSSTNRSEND